VEKVVMTQDHMVRFVKAALGDRYSSKEIESLYRNVVSKKPLTVARFIKKFM
jgi:hypothetical protein